MQQSKHSALRLYGAILTPLVLGVMAGFLFVPDTLRDRFSEEGNLLGQLTFFLLVAGVAGACYVALRSRSTGWGLFALWITFAALREIDAHKAWTSMSILKLRFYTSDAIALPEKLGGGIVIGIVLISLVAIARRIPAGLRSVAKAEPVAIVTSCALVLFILAKLMDGSGRYFPSIRDTLSQIEFSLRMMEEITELYASGLLMPTPWIAQRLPKVMQSCDAR